MSDPTVPTPVAEAAPVPAPLAPAAAAPAAASPAPAPASPPFVNPWVKRLAEKAASASPSAPAAPAPAQPPAAPVAAPAEPVSAPAADPRVDALMGVLAETVAQDLAAVPPAVAATIKAIAGDDPVAQRKALNAMRANGLATGAAPIAAPASTTMPVAPASPVAASPADTDASRLAEYDKLSRVAPILAAQYRAAHAPAIDRAIKSRAPSN